MSEFVSVLKNAKDPPGVSSKRFLSILEQSNPSAESKKNNNFNQDESKKNYTNPQNSINPNDKKFIERRILLSSLLIDEFTKMDLKVKKYSPKVIKKSNFGEKNTKKFLRLCRDYRVGKCNNVDCRYKHIKCNKGDNCRRVDCFFGHSNKWKYCS